jgi:hypothetical protein
VVLFFIPAALAAFLIVLLTYQTQEAPGTKVIKLFHQQRNSSAVS